MSIEIIVMLPGEYEAWCTSTTVDNTAVDNMTTDGSSADESVTVQSNPRPAMVP